MTDKPAQRNVVLMLKNKRLGFPDLAAPRSINGGKPVYGSRLIIEPTDPDVKVIDAAMAEVAKAQWKDASEGALAMLIKKGRVAFSKEEYCNKDGKVYKGFEGNYSLGANAPEDKQPTFFDEYGNPITDMAVVKRKFYAGCMVNAKVEIYPLLRDDGNRISCQALGFMFAGDGEAFGGGTGPADASDFAGMAKAAPDADDVL